MDIFAHKIVNSEIVFTFNLVNRIQIGDQSAEAEFVKFYSDILMSILISDTQESDIARGCYQKPLLIALKKIRSGDIRIYARMTNDGPATVFDFDKRFRISEPYQTVGETFSSKL